ncbi:LOW QUALITY PROTEIN: serotransferrin-like [Microtus pennsylvanicus]|uniref:LOW QUALITY PROTEIN: serotransferrin-like n=1 Tax=Microtus pennsylvanicus TaxID=10058 RepID=UPI003F6B918C
MRSAVGALLACAALGLCLAVPDKTVKWCAISEHENTKCISFRDHMKNVLPADGPQLACVKKTSYTDCIKAIAGSEADAITLDAGWVYEAGLSPNNLKPVVAEVYGTPEKPQTSYLAVAVVKKGSGFQLDELQGKKSCHTGLGRSAGWNIPVGLLFCKFPEPRSPIEKAVASFFSGSCVPCADSASFPKLCQLCPGCGCSSLQPYYGYAGAFKCLKDGGGDVAFVKHTTIFEVLPQKSDRDQYELLCPDNTRKPVDQFEECYLARVPSHAVVARAVDGKEDLIWEILKVAQENFGKGQSKDFQLFDSPLEKDLLFKNSAIGLLKIPSRMDYRLYLGHNYVTAIRNVREGECPESPSSNVPVKWCALGHHERQKCDEWSVNSGGQIDCESAETTEDCIDKIVNGEADAMSLDGGYAYIAGQCGLVPVMAENYDSSDCGRLEKGYYAVAVVKASNRDITWEKLKGKKSCHTAVDRTAGWNIPMGLLYSRTKSCKFDEYFSQGCAPGYEKNSTLCDLCMGPNKCAPNNREGYFGYTGAFRCLVEKGDVAFVKHQTVMQNTEGKNPDAWAKDLKLTDFELLCPDGSRKPVTEYASCHLAQAPNHVVVSRKEKAARVSTVLRNQQDAFGSNADCSTSFCLFKSTTKDLLFRDDTKCLYKVPDGTTWEKYLGEDYVQAVGNMKKCSTSRNRAPMNYHSRDALRPGARSLEPRRLGSPGRPRTSLMASVDTRRVGDSPGGAFQPYLDSLRQELQQRDPTLLSMAVALLAVLLTLVFWKFIWSRKSSQRAVLLVGLCDSGKTLLFVRLLTGHYRDTQTSITDSSAAYKVNNNRGNSLTLIDLPGHESLRLQFLDRFKSSARAVVFVVDSAAFQREVKDVAEFLYQVLIDSMGLKNAPSFLIACNKQDIAMAKSAKLIQQQLEKELNTLRVTRSAAPSTLDSSSTAPVQLGKKGKEFEFSQLPLKVEFLECSAKGGRGDADTADIQDLEKWLAKIA